MTTSLSPAFFDDDSNPALQEKTDFLEQWRMICELYSSRSLSQPGDKLPAMSVIVDYVRWTSERRLPGWALEASFSS
jgi:hypothetical protein